MATLPMKMNEAERESLRATAQALKQKFLDQASPLMEEYIGAALGTKELSSNNSGAREEVWEVLKTLILQSSDKLDIEVKSAEDILEAVSKGKCTFEEGEKLLNLYKKLKEIKDIGLVPGLGGARQGSGLVINIQAAPTQTLAQPIDQAIEVASDMIPIEEAMINLDDFDPVEDDGDSAL